LAVSAFCAPETAEQLNQFLRFMVAWPKGTR